MTRGEFEHPKCHKKNPLAKIRITVTTTSDPPISEQSEPAVTLLSIAFLHHLVSFIQIPTRTKNWHSSCGLGALFGVKEILGGEITPFFRFHFRNSRGNVCIIIFRAEKRVILPQNHQEIARKPVLQSTNHLAGGTKSTRSPRRIFHSYLDDQCHFAKRFILPTTRQLPEGLGYFNLKIMCGRVQCHVFPGALGIFPNEFFEETVVKKNSYTNKYSQYDSSLTNLVPLF